jgi:hypothetical protein
MELFFIYNNLKAKPLKPLSDASIPGFRVLTWNAEVDGTLWDIGNDSGYTRLGISKVQGQLWIPDNYNNYSDLKSFCRVDEGITEITKVKAKFKIEPDDIIAEEIEVLTFALISIKPQYEIIRNGVWSN